MAKKKTVSSKVAETEISDDAPSTPSTPVSSLSPMESYQGQKPTNQAATYDLTNEEIADRLHLTVMDDQETFRHVKVQIFELAKNEFKVVIVNQSHGFCNFLVSKVLNIPGVLYAAYKLTSLEPAMMNIKTDGSKDIKKILREATEKMRDDLKILSKLFADMKI
jgi:DNA-directed RNA polymerase subunit L